MSARAGTGWQTALADLSLILFMVTAAAHVRQRPAAREEEPAGAPLAVWSEGAGAPPLGSWLAAQSPDMRQQVTITARYQPGEQSAALSAAGRLMEAAGSAGSAARIVLEPGEGAAQVVVAFDAPEGRLAYALRDGSLNEGTSPRLDRDRP